MNQRSQTKSVLWAGGELPLWEVCTLSRVDGEFHIAGTVIGTLGQSLLDVRYLVSCGADWKTKEVEVELRKGGKVQQLNLRVREGGRWFREEREMPEFLGLTDIDINVTPSTNTLPIRRLNLPVGSHSDTTAVWIKLPGFEIQQLPQRYTRIAERRYLYESGGGRFKAELEVDEFGLVRSYGKFWRAQDNI